MENKNELHDLYQLIDIVAHIKMRRLRCPGQMIIMDGGRLIKQTLDDKPAESRQAERKKTEMVPECRQ